MKNLTNLLQATTNNDLKIIFKSVHGIDDTDRVNDYNLIKTLDLFISLNRYNKDIIKLMSIGFQREYNKII